MPGTMDTAVVKFVVPNVCATAFATVRAAVRARCRVAVSCDSIVRRRSAPVITTTVPSVTTAIHAAYWTLTLYFAAMASRSRAPYFPLASDKGQDRPALPTRLCAPQELRLVSRER